MPLPAFALLLLIAAPALADTAASTRAPPATATAAEALFNAGGYRQARYRSPTPASVEHAVTLETPALLALLNSAPKPALIDSFRTTWQDNHFIYDEDHANLPNSLWLGYIGDPELTAAGHDYLVHYLAQVSGGNPAHPLVFYCKSDCWMSWNAVRRAHALGYTRLYWYRDGIDAWAQAGLPLVPARPAAAIRQPSPGR